MSDIIADLKKKDCKFYNSNYNMSAELEEKNELIKDLKVRSCDQFN